MKNHIKYLSVLILLVLTSIISNKSYAQCSSVTLQNEVNVPVNSGSRDITYSTNGCDPLSVNLISISDPNMITGVTFSYSRIRFNYSASSIYRESNFTVSVGG